VKCSKRTIFVVEQHHQVLQLWRDQALSSQQVLHLDFHCDLRGLLIDRSAQRAYRIWDRFPDVDEGNFLTHAVLERAVTSIRWVHDEPGGRQHDLQTVKYESDLTSLFHRCALWLRRDRGVPIAYEAIPHAKWAGLRPGEILDIDWDFFASKEYPRETIPQRVDAFLSRDFACRPEHVYVCYSPAYSHPTRGLFQGFVRNLASRFQAEIVSLPAPPKVLRKRSLCRRLLPVQVFQSARQIYRFAGLALRKRGIY
jgi:hypothetical protein